MMVKVFISFILVLAYLGSAFALEYAPSVCGEYEIAGKIKLDSKGKPYLSVHENTNSEFVIRVSEAEELKIGGYLNQDALIKTKLFKKFDGNVGYISQVLNVEMYNPYINSLYPRYGFTLLKKESCKNEK